MNYASACAWTRPKTRQNPAPKRYCHTYKILLAQLVESIQGIIWLPNNVDSWYTLGFQISVCLSVC